MKSTLKLFYLLVIFMLVISCGVKAELRLPSPEEEKAYSGEGNNKKEEPVGYIKKLKYLYE